MRDCTLKDARQLNLVPGVSSILRMEHAEQLQRWMIQQALLASATLPRNEGESADQFVKRADKDSKAQTEKARARGALLHAEVERVLTGQIIDPENMPFVQPVVDFLKKEYGGRGEAEHSFAHKLGYGGKIDWHSRETVVTCDFKFRAIQREDVNKRFAFESHHMQLEAYTRGIEMPNALRVNLFISTEVPGLIICHEWPKEDWDDQWEAFRLLLRLWQIRKHFNTSWES